MKKFFRYFFWSVSVGIMVAIFCLSNQVAEESQQTSESLTKKIFSASESFRNLPEEKQDEIVEGVQFVVRKTAHFSAYTALAVSLCSAILLTFKGKFLWLYAFSGTALYAISDEVHQYFVPGRSMEVRDVLIDSSGALLGVLLVMYITALIKRKSKD